MKRTNNNLMWSDIERIFNINVEITDFCTIAWIVASGSLYW